MVDLNFSNVKQILVKMACHIVQHVGVVELQQFALLSDFLNSVLASSFEIKRVLSYTESISRLDPEKVEILIIVKVTLQILREIKEKM